MTPATIIRRQDWPSCLAAYFAAVRDRPFTWGRHDCGLFAAGAILAMTDHDPAEALRGTYGDAQGARVAIAAYGPDVWAMPPTQGYSEIAPAQASRGDLVGALFKRRRALGVCGGRRSAFVGPRGLVWIPTLDCHLAWKV